MIAPRNFRVFHQCNPKKANGRNRTIAIAGTSGKSSTTGMLAFSMEALGLDPGLIGGGRVTQFRSPWNPGNVRVGNSGLLVVEACESDEGIRQYRPSFSAILNLSLDHQDIPETLDRFRQLAQNTSEALIINGDDEALGSLAHRKMVRFGISSRFGLHPGNVTLAPFGSQFTVRGTSFRIQQPGAHNVMNALAVIATLEQLGVPFSSMPDPLAAFEGIDRRFDIHLNNAAGLVVDDYAHNPDKIAALMAATRPVKDRILYVFQPHGYGPTRLMLDGYIETFRAGLRQEDRLLILPIYYAGGTVRSDISSDDIVRPLAAAGRPAETIRDRNAVTAYLKDFSAVVVFGARDETLPDFTAEIARKLEKMSKTVDPGTEGSKI